MKKKISDDSNIKFEKLDQNDNAMERIFDEITNIPKKDNPDTISNLKLFYKKKRSSILHSFSKPEQEIDLHGKTREESILIVQNFVMNCYRDKLNSALIITGKGHNSGENGPVLNKEVKIWLEKNGDSYISDFFDAPPRYGGSGAIWIIFKKKTN